MSLLQFHRRPLPPELVDFSSPQGRLLLREALSAGTAESFFPLVAQLHTQAEPTWCGLGTLVTVLNALGVDPGRVWKGVWRWFGEELLTCCQSLDAVAAEGLTLDEVACLARCNGAAVDRVFAEDGGEAGFREALADSVAAPAGPFLVAAYARRVLGQTGTGHYSPLGAWHRERDAVLVLDVARFKYPPHWAPVGLLWEAMRGIDPDSGRPRGWLRLGATPRPQVDLEAAAALSAKLGTLGAPEPLCCPPADALV